MKVELFSVNWPEPVLVIVPAPPRGNPLAKTTLLPLVSKVADWPATMGARLAEMSCVLPLDHWSVPLEPKLIRFVTVLLRERAPSVKLSKPPLIVVAPA